MYLYPIIPGRHYNECPDLIINPCRAGHPRRATVPRVVGITTVINITISISISISCIAFALTLPIVYRISPDTHVEVEYEEGVRGWSISLHPSHANYTALSPTIRGLQHMYDKKATKNTRESKLLHCS